MNAASNRDFEVEKLAVLREQGAITDEEYQWARLAVLREQGAISDEEYHEARRRFRMEVERLESQRARGAINDHQYQQARRHCAMRLTTAATETAHELLDKAIRSSQAGFVMVCVATAAATWLLILDQVDPYADKVPLGVGVGLFLTSIVLGPVALGVLLSALSQADRCLVPVPGPYQMLAFAGLFLAVVGAIEVGYLIVSNLGGTL